LAGFIYFQSIKMFAVVEFGAHQYKVAKGSVLNVAKIDAMVGAEVPADSVLMLFDENGATFELGAPFVNGAKVKAKILEHGLDDKIKVFKFKAKKRYAKTQGHRQAFTKIEIVELSK
jgi:large subunit ribosomal protein L21